MANKKLRYQCHKCSERFISWQKRDVHIDIKHKPPVKTIKSFIRTNDYHTLKNGDYLELGDKIIFTKRGFITKITLTEGKTTVEVECSLIENSWKKD